ncbi:MAG: hypothetical protein ACRD0H_24775 [Actinomycetes bacterium]
MCSEIPGHLTFRERLAGADGLDATLADEGDAHYLVVHVVSQSGHCWICAPVTDRAVSAVRDGRTSPWAVVHHSRTGTVDIFRTMGDGSVRSSVALCSSLPADSGVLAAA